MGKKMDLLFKTKQYIEEHDLVQAGDHLLVCVSGGIDSMVLASLLMKMTDEIGFLMSVAHVDHGLRGKDSDNDEKFVRKFCKDNKLPFYSKKWTGPKDGENLQEVARNFRYEFFVSTATKRDASKIALAHNMDDQAETIFLNLLRGASLDGICGMSPKRLVASEIYLIRPLLEVGRAEIENYALTENVAYRNDVSNDQTKYSRNFIRHHIMPLVREINPNASSSISKMAKLLKLDDEYILEQVVQSLFSIVALENENRIELKLSGFKALRPTIRMRILKLSYIKLNGSVAGIAKDHIDKMDDIAMSNKIAGHYSLPAGLKFEKSRAVLAIFRD